jgi:hypothetical protein
MEYREVNNQRLSDFFTGKRAVGALAAAPLPLKVRFCTVY